MLSHRAGLWQPLPDDISDACLGMPRLWLRGFVFRSLSACLFVFLSVFVCLLVCLFGCLCVCVCVSDFWVDGSEGLAFYGSH